MASPYTPAYPPPGYYYSGYYPQTVISAPPAQSTFYPAPVGYPVTYPQTVNVVPPAQPFFPSVPARSLLACPQPEAAGAPLAQPFFSPAPARSLLAYPQAQAASASPAPPTFPSAPARKDKTPPPVAIRDYLHPEGCRIIDEPMPIYRDPTLVTGVFYNILFPVERQNREQPTLVNYLLNSLKGKIPDFLTAEQFETINGYVLKAVPKKVFFILLAQHTLEVVRKGEPIAEALNFVQQKLENESIPACQAVIAELQQLQKEEQKAQGESGSLSLSPTYQRFTLLIESLSACVTTVETLMTLIAPEKKLIEEEFEKGNDEGVSLLVEKSKIQKYDGKALGKEKTLKLFENRLRVIEQAVEEILVKTPDAASFLAFQEVTPDALEEMKTCWKKWHFTWISINNVSGEETAVKPREKIFEESTAFTSTLALNPFLKMRRQDSALLPSASGSVRRILGVEVFNLKTRRPFIIFTTHTDHVIADRLYHDTTVAIHRFIMSFFQQTLFMPFVFGGDLNAFEALGAAQFIHELRQGPFARGQDYREGEAFYVPKSIAYTTYIGKEGARYKATLLADGTLTANALDHIITNDLKVVTGTRSAVVYDSDGRLVDPYTQPQLYQERLAARRTASDHTLNAVVFRA